MSQKSSVPQAISFVSQVLKRDTRAFKSPWQRSAGPVLGDFVELKGPYRSGFHSRANLWASAICSDVICLAT